MKQGTFYGISHVVPRSLDNGAKVGVPRKAIFSATWAKESRAPKRTTASTRKGKYEVGSSAKRSSRGKRTRPAVRAHSGTPWVAPLQLERLISPHEQLDVARAPWHHRGAALLTAGMRLAQEARTRAKCSSTAASISAKVTSRCVDCHVASSRWT
jgi:hypothetical protein